MPRRYTHTEHVNLGTFKAPNMVQIRYQVHDAGVFGDNDIARSLPHCVVDAGEKSGISQIDGRARSKKGRIVRKDFKTKIMKALREKHGNVIVLCDLGKGKKQ